MSIFEPDLHSHFKDEAITSSYFASAWFITIFTNSIKNVQPPQGEDALKDGEMGEVSEHLLQLWDYFLVAGWKAILKIGLFILKDSSNELLQLSFEEILNEISEKPKALLLPAIKSEEESKDPAS